MRLESGSAKPDAGGRSLGSLRFLGSLRAQILLWTILPLIIILVAVSLGSITLHQSSMRSMVAERDAHLAGIAAQRLDDKVSARATALRTVLAGLSGATDSAALSRLQPATDLFDRGVYVLDRSGAVVMEVPGTSVPGRADLAQAQLGAAAAPGRPFYRLASGSETPALLETALADPESGLTVIGAISREGLDLPALFDQLNRSPRTESYLIGPGGIVLYHRDGGEIGRDYSIHSGVMQALRGESGATFEHLPGEDEHVVGYAPLATTGWGLLVEEPWVDVIVPGLQYTLWAPLLVLVAAIASLVAIHFGLRRVVHPLQVLGRAASRLAWGDFQAIDRPAGGIGEITDLQAALQEMAAQINRYQAGMRDYIAALTATQEEERRRLARELHDETVQSIIALGQRVKILQLDLQDGRAAAHERDAEDVDARLNELGEMIAACLKDVRGLIRDLRPIYLEELGLASALEMLARGASGSQMNATLEVEGAERRLSPEAELAVYRIAQAAVSNAQHHSAAATVAVRLEFGDDGVVLTVEDDGAGFAPPDRPSDLALEGHFGLMGMYERATRLGGHLSIRSSPGAGAKIAAFLPYAGQIAAS